MTKKDFNEKYINFKNTTVTVEEKSNDIKKIKRNLKFYRYYDLSKSHTLENIENGIIHFSNPQLFNDPFDCACGLDFDNMLKDEIIKQYLKLKKNDILSLVLKNDFDIEVPNDIIKKFINEVGIKEEDITNEEYLKEKYFEYLVNSSPLMNDKFGISRKELDLIIKKFNKKIEKKNRDYFNNSFYECFKMFIDLIKEYCPNATFSSEFSLIDSEINKLLNNIKDIISSKLRIVCFSENFDIPLMWSHYANKHEGICVEYDFEYSDEILIDCLFPVNYKNERPFLTTEMLLNKETLKEKILGFQIIKSKCWRYEKEWRVLLPKKYLTADNNFKAPRITKVFFGVNISEEKYNEISTKIQKFDSNIECIKMKMHYKEYKICKE